MRPSVLVLSLYHDFFVIIIQNLRNTGYCFLLFGGEAVEKEIKTNDFMRYITEIQSVEKMDHDILEDYQYGGGRYPGQCGDKESGKQRSISGGIAFLIEETRPRDEFSSGNHKTYTKGL